MSSTAATGIFHISNGLSCCASSKMIFIFSNGNNFMFLMDSGEAFFSENFDIQFINFGSLACYNYVPKEHVELIVCTIRPIHVSPKPVGSLIFYIQVNCIHLII